MILTEGANRNIYIIIMPEVNENKEKLWSRG